MKKTKMLVGQLFRPNRVKVTAMMLLFATAATFARELLGDDDYQGHKESRKQ